MAVRLITGLPGAGKTTWCKENCTDGILIHTDDLYYTRHDDRLPEKFFDTEWKDMCLNFSLNNIVDILEEDEKLYYLEGYHLLLWLGFDTLTKHLYKLFVTEPDVCYTNLIKKEWCVFSLEELKDKHEHLIKSLVKIVPDEALINPFYEPIRKAKSSEHYTRRYIDSLRCPLGIAENVRIWTLYEYGDGVNKYYYLSVLDSDGYWHEYDPMYIDELKIKLCELNIPVSIFDSDKWTS